MRKLFKINYFKKTDFFAAVFAILFFGFTTSPIYAQYYSYNANNYSQFYITTTNATNITSSSAILNGLVNGNNLYNTYNITTWFEYGTNSNFGSSTLQNFSNSGYANFSSSVAGLSANTVYYFRAVAQNPQGIIYGSVNSFRTNFQNIINNNNNTSSALTAITMPASVSSGGAQLNSFILNQMDDSANAWFEWGTTLNLGNITTPVSTGTLASVKHINTLTGLAPATTYYFRAVAQNSSLRNNGSVLSFTTNGNMSQNTANQKITNTPVLTEENITDNTDFIRPVKSALEANVFGSSSFFPINILGWLILFILIFVLILLTKRARD